MAEKKISLRDRIREVLNPKTWHPCCSLFATVAVIYALCRIKNYYCHPYLFSHEVYDCQVDASITVLVGFFLGYWVFAMMMKWRKKKLEKMQAFRKPEASDVNVSVDVGQGSATTTAFIELGNALRNIGNVDKINVDGTIYERKQPEERPKDNNPHMMNK